MKSSNWQPLSDAFRRERALGREEGREERREEGRDEGARHLIRTLCAAIGVEWSDARERAVATMSLVEIDRLAATLAATRRWPD